STTMRHINRVGHILVKKRKLSAADLKDLLAEQRLLGWKFGHIAVDSGKVAKQDLEDALKEQIQEEINDMFLWSDAQFEYVQGPPKNAADSPLSEVAYTQNLSSLILEAAYHADEILALRQIFETDNVIMGQTGKPIPTLS